MKQYHVYERSHGDFQFVNHIRAKDAQEAKRLWDHEYGHNYGRVLILPLSALLESDHVAYD